MHDSLAPDETRRLNDLAALCARARRLVATPCFGHLRVETARGTRDYLLGAATAVDDGVTVLDWQTAPLAGVFFAARTDEDYEITVDGRTLAGVVRARHLLGFEGDALREVRDETVVCFRANTPDGPWQRAQPEPPWLRPRPTGAARLPPPWTLDALDPEQRRAVELPAATPLLVLGEAGCGKTTVALHRLADLYRRATADGARAKDFRALVIVPVEGLRRLSEAMLARLGAAGVEVRTYERWAAVQARRVFPSVPRREHRDAPPAVMRLKRHPALGPAIAAIAARGRGRAGARRSSVTRGDLLHLFGDRGLLEQTVARAGDALGAHGVHQTLEHTRAQFRDTAEEEFAHVDAENKETVDGLRLDAGTPAESAGTIDVEDYAVLFALAAARGIDATPAQYDCVLLDEAQEFAPIELALLGRALRPGGALIVAGDEGQQVDPTSYFDGWDTALAALGVSDAARVRLAVSYRCPMAVTLAARAVLDPATEAQASTALDALVPAEAAAMNWHLTPNACHLAAVLTDALRTLRSEDPQASVAVICRTPETAARVVGWLARGADARLVREGDFRFAPGVEVACVHDVKGLEFDHVVVCDASPEAYPEGGEARRAMYVAMTRASHQLVLATVGRWSPVTTPRGR